MFKTLTMSLSLAAALSLSGVSKAGDLFHGACASPQCAPSEQACPSPQAACEPACAPKCNLFEKLQCGLGNFGCGLKEAGCGFKKTCGGIGCGLKDTCGGIQCGLKDLCVKMKPKPKCYTYEWVLKKKRVWGCHGECGSPGCNTCTPSSQCAPAPSGQGEVAPAPQSTYSAPQATYSAPAAYGAGQYASAAPAPVGMISPAPTYSAPAAAPVPVGGDEAPPAPVAPKVSAPAAPAVPAAPAAPAVPPAPPAPGATSGLLFSTPSGN
jgi:hypothetical protein